MALTLQYEFMENPLSIQLAERMVEKASKEDKIESMEGEERICFSFLRLLAPFTLTPCHTQFVHCGRDAIVL